MGAAWANVAGADLPHLTILGADDLSSAAIVTNSWIAAATYTVEPCVSAFNGGTGQGVRGISSQADGVHGETGSSQHAGVAGVNTNTTNTTNGPGVSVQATPFRQVSTAPLLMETVCLGGLSTTASMVCPPVPATAEFGVTTPARAMVFQERQMAISEDSGIAAGVWGNALGGAAGVKGTSQSGNGVIGFTSGSGAAVSCVNLGGGVAVYAKGKPAGQFEGDVEVNGKLNVTLDVVLTGADFAEDFAVEASQNVEPGTVMVLDENGVLRPCNKSYDRKVAGVISGAGDYKPGLILDRQKSSEGRLPLALVGKVYCKADATHGAIEVGDLLTTSPTPGHAMKASDPARSFGALLGKALRPLRSGKGLVPILIALQ